MGLFRRKRRGIVSGTFGESTAVYLGTPREMPSAEKLEKLREVCARHPEIAEALVAQRLVVGQRLRPGHAEAPTIVLGLCFDDTSRASETFQEIGDAVHPLRPGDETLDFERLEQPLGDPWLSVYQR